MTVPRVTTSKERGPMRDGIGNNGGDQLLALLQVANASFPTGAFSHSYGFETWIAEGVVTNATTAETHCRDWLRFGIATADGVAVAAAYRDTLYDAMDGIVDLDRRIDALKLARETRSASTKTGAALIAACREIFKLDEAVRLDALVRSGETPGHHAVVYGVAGAALGFTEHQTVASFLWTGFSNLVSVVARLVPLGQVEAQRIVAAGAPLVEDCAEIARTRPVERMGSLLASLDTAAMRHERLPSRLCIS
jgi:urease accessory protein